MGGGRSSRAKDFPDGRDQRGACSAGADACGGVSDDVIDADANIRRQVMLQMMLKLVLICQNWCHH